MENSPEFMPEIFAHYIGCLVLHWFASAAEEHEQADLFAEEVDRVSKDIGPDWTGYAHRILRLLEEETYSSGPSVN